eukprot:TRINITY_DN11187_c0_g2_i2.p1 TRINITY_DN11187_c0_g2~~TRINITY_DN11187_c0_g2_i2.p1  ORF type:complete len:231 (+),score=79.51 TRINITY_DN11187_c0_g2_i2:81-773(+)
MKKVKQRRFNNISPLYRGNLKKLVENAPARTPTARSIILLPRNPSLPKPADQNMLVKSPNLQPPQVLLDKVLSLKKEKTEVALASQKRKASLRHIIEKLNVENKALKSVVRKLIPVVEEKMSPRTKEEVKGLLECGERSERGVQCELASPEQEASTGTQSSGANKYELKASSEDFENYKANYSENNCMKSFVEFMMKKEEYNKKHFMSKDSLDKSSSVLPGFLKSLCISS